MIFEKTGQLKTVWHMSWPSMLESLLDTFVSYIDMFMVSVLGTAATAAVGVTTSVNWVIAGTVRALGVGFLACISRSLGAGDKEKAKRITAQSVFAAVIVGVVFMAAALSVADMVPVWMNADVSVRADASRYFSTLYRSMIFRAFFIMCATSIRAGGDTRTPMRIAIGVNLVNILGNFFLIYETRNITFLGLSFTCPGAGMGVTGAAAASALSYVVGGVVTFICLYKNKAVSPKGYSVLPDTKLLRPVLRIAIPNMLQRFCTSFGYVVFAGQINALGAVATASHTLANTVEQMFYIPASGMQTAAATLTGMAIGAQDEKLLRSQEKTFLLLELGIMTFTSAILFFFAPELTGIFSKDAAVLAMTVPVLRMVAVSEPLFGVSLITGGMLQGAGLTAKPFLINVVSMWIVRIGGTFVCLHFFHGGLSAAWGCMIACNMIQMLLYRIYYDREKPQLFQNNVKVKKAY